MNKVKMKQAEGQEERTDTIIEENEKLGIELEGAKFLPSYSRITP